METQKKIYYATSLQTYNTIKETNEFAYLYSKFHNAEIINPAHLYFKGMKEFLKIVDKCNLVIVSELNDYVGKGVLCEVTRAFSNGTQVRVIRENAGNFILCDVVGFEIENVSDWRYTYAKLIVNQ